MKTFLFSNIPKGINDIWEEYELKFMSIDRILYQIYTIHAHDFLKLKF